MTCRAIRLQSRNLVFVVDDDPAILLDCCGSSATPAYCFHLRKLSQTTAISETRFASLLDINLGDGSGIGLRHRLKATNISVPVIYMTGNDNPVVRETALQSGCLAYLTKPFSAKSLMEPLERASAS
jgi:FixJ family two-component response regulator